MKVLFLILLVSNLHAQDSATVKLLTDNINTLRLSVLLLQKENDRQDKMILLLTDSLIHQNKKVFVLGVQNDNLLKKKSDKWFKFGQIVGQLIILYFTSR